MPKWLAAALVCLALYVLFFAGLTRTGLLGPDEPRYASIGREMARSGDWITPRLWGQPWFEKPALLYWMTGLAFRLGLSEDLAPRLPVALTSVAFLVFYHWILRREFSPLAAGYATAILATSAGWLGLSHVGTTDLPMTACFAAAMLLSLGQPPPKKAAALLGLAVLAKGLVPLALALPLAWHARRRLLDPRLALVFLAAAAPWYLLCYWRNGWPFIQTLFIEHHFGRFTSEVLLHGRPWWFYAPVLPAALFPWTPAALLLFRRDAFPDPRRRFLLLWMVFGFLFLSASANKLPGYILPLLPAAAAMMGLALAEARDTRPVLAAAAALLCATVPLASILPQALAAGLSRVAFPTFHWTWLLPMLLAIPAWFLSRPAAVACLSAAVVTGVLFLKLQSFPAIDAVSARPRWGRIESRRNEACIGGIHRNLRYGLNYYSVTPLPDCEDLPKAVRVE
ncbi:MAG: glycosyltransferase family 39 protein [Candidatus Solibacter usitatus]|nr:glycosyltransferase family 39 protein [Candidatus Solibacter usitatus]